MPFTQANRRFRVATPLESDVLVLRRLSGSESISRLFEFELELHSEDIDVDHNTLLGENVTVGMKMPDGEERFLNGFVSRFTVEGYDDRHVVYRATLSPWLWFLTRTSDCRIFQEMTVPDIIKQVFGDHGFADYEDKLTATYREWEYCVQYRETDFNFVCRLMEQEGIYFYFKHENGKHNLVLADAPSAHEPVTNYEEVPYFPPDASNRKTRDHLYSWSASKQVQPGSYALTDFDFKAPKKDLASIAEVTREHSSSEFQIYDYPGEYAESSDGEAYAKARIQELQAQHEVLQGDGDAAGLMPGAVFELIDYPREDQNRQYLIIGASYDLSSPGLEGGQDDEGEQFHVQIQAIDAEQHFRPARTTPKPMVQGVQTAIVVGPKGEEIHTDEFGRVKVKFHWDRYSKADEDSSCFIRVAQVWAGKNWGGIYTPRIGQEVIVDFIEGDPDRPIITGRVYNKDNTPPYELPANKTLSGIKSNSSKGGEGFNEIRFEDKKGEEQLFIHGEKNQDINIKSDCYETIGHDRNLVVKNDQVEHVENNRSETVDADHIEKIGKDRHLTVDGKEAKKVAASLSLTVGGDVAEVFKANHSMEVTDDCYVKASNICIEATDNITIKVGDSYIAIESGGIKIGTNGDIVLEAGGNMETTVASDVTTDVGGNMEDTVGGNVKIEAGAKLDAKSGANLKIDAGANLDTKSAANTTIESGAMGDFKATGIATVKGSMVKIN